MVVGHPGEHGRVALWHVAVDLKVESDHVPILVHIVVAVIAEETTFSPSHATQTVVQVIEMPLKPPP